MGPETDTPAAADPQDRGTAPLLAPPTHWPPRIPRTQASWWKRLRDLVLTLLAWLAYLWILREPVIACIGWLSPTLGARLEQVIEVAFTLNLWPYPWIAAGLVTWIALWGVRHRRRLQQQASGDHDVPALLPEAQFATAGVPGSELSVWRGARCLHVQYDTEGRITGATPSPRLHPFSG